ALINGRLAAEDAMLGEGDVVELLPVISGGSGVDGYH
ncbi:MAG: MoaD/ThiS family protein, partial [Anaerolineae bacterium]|nr:MoaD/ThiS family protein [Anaerolineae bacterium]